MACKPYDNDLAHLPDEPNRVKPRARRLAEVEDHGRYLAFDVDAAGGEG